nr:MAG TPA: hypothetical protein [Caudoviricetes sp.]
MQNTKKQNTVRDSVLTRHIVHLPRSGTRKGNRNH